MRQSAAFLLVLSLAALAPIESKANEPEPLALSLRHGFSDGFFTSVGRGYVFGIDALISTDDGGVSWRLVLDSKFDSIFFLSADRFWVLSRPGELLTTSDGGESFQSLAPTFLDHESGERTGLCGRFMFLTETEGWGVCRRNVLRTNDGGQSWTSYLLSRAIGEPDQIWMFDANEGIAIDQFRPVARTTDGGVTWTVLSNGPKLGHLSCTAAGFCAGLAGPHGPILISSDRGQTWQDTQAPLQLPDRDSLRSVQAVAPTLVVAVGQDGGFSPKEDLSPLIGTKTPMASPDPARGIILRWDGITWVRFEHEDPVWFAGGVFLDSEDGWLFGSGYNLIYRTTDGGESVSFVPDYFRQIQGVTPTLPPVFTAPIFEDTPSPTP